MRFRKRLSVCITAFLLIVSFAAASAVADNEGTAYPLTDGLTITLPPEFEGPLWIGMDEDHPEMAYVREMYDEFGLTIQCDAPAVGENNGQLFFVTEHVKDAPSDLSESTFISNVTTNIISDEKDLEDLEILGKGVIHVGDIDIYKTCSNLSLNFDYEVQARYKMRSHKYAFVTETGKIHEIE